MDEMSTTSSTTVAATMEESTNNNNNGNGSTVAGGVRPRQTRIKLRDVNDHLTCFICKGYYIDATTIVECLHSFCRSCIIKHLQFKSYCPVCEMMINKAKPNIKPDKTLQDIVYKLVPGLHRDEMRRRREFYNNQDVSSPASLLNGSGGCGGGGGVGGVSGDMTITPEQRGEDNERVIYNATDPISLSLEYCSSDCDILSITNNNNNEFMKVEKDNCREMENPPIRYLQCPAGLTVRLLKKFLIGKFDINVKQFHVDILYKRVPLPDDYKLMDIAYIYSWKRSEPMRIFYRVTDIKYAINRFDYFDPGFTYSSVKRKTNSSKEHNKENHQQITKDEKTNGKKETGANANKKATIKTEDSQQQRLEKKVNSENDVKFDKKCAKENKITRIKCESESDDKNNKLVDRNNADNKISDKKKEKSEIKNENCEKSDVLVNSSSRNEKSEIKQEIKKESDVERCENKVLNDKNSSENVILEKKSESDNKCDSENVNEKQKVCDQQVSGKLSPKEKSNTKSELNKINENLCRSDESKQESHKKSNKSEVITNKSVISDESTPKRQCDSEKIDSKCDKTNNKIVKSDHSEKTPEKNPPKISHPVKDTCDKPKTSPLKCNEIPLSSILKDPPKIIIDEENEKEKSLFLNTFQLTSTKSLSPKKIESNQSVSPKPSSSTTTSTKQKNSPKKTSPKNNQSTQKSTFTPIAPKTNARTQKANANKSVNNLTPVPNNNNNSHKTVSNNNSKQSLPADRPKRKYTFKNRQMSKKARLELEKLNNTVTSPIKNALISTMMKADKKMNMTNSTINTIVQNVAQQSNHIQKLVSTNSQQSTTATGAEKRKCVSFKLDKDIVPEKRTKLANNPTSTTKLIEISNRKDTTNPSQQNHNMRNMSSVPPQTTNSLKSLFDNCNLNIPSSLSITLTEGPNDKNPNQMENPMNNVSGKRQSPPVNMFIEIFKIPENNETTPSANIQATGNNGNNNNNNTNNNNNRTTSTTQQQSSGKVVASNMTNGELQKTNYSQESPNVNVPSKQQNVHKVTSLSSTNFVVTTTGIQSLGRKDEKLTSSTTTSFNVPKSNIPNAPIPTDAKNKKILPKPPSSTSSVPSSSTNFIPKLAESPKSSTGFQKMFEEAIKRKEAAKAQQLVPSKISTPKIKIDTTKTLLNSIVNNKKPKLDDQKKNDITPLMPTNSILATSPPPSLLSPTVLDLSSPNPNKRQSVSPPTQQKSPNLPSARSPQPSIMPNFRSAPNVPIHPRNKKSTSPQSNLITSTDTTNHTITTTNNGPNGRCATPLPALSVSVIPNSGATNTTNSTNTMPRDNMALSPTTIQQQYNLTNLAQLRQVMLLRQLEMRQHLLQNSPTNGETLMQFENYMKSLQQAHQNAIAKK